MQVQDNLFQIFIWKMLTLLPKKWNKMIWEKQLRWYLFYSAPHRSYIGSVQWYWHMHNNPALPNIVTKKTSYIVLYVASSGSFEVNWNSHDMGMHRVMVTGQFTQQNVSFKAHQSNYLMYVCGLIGDIPFSSVKVRVGLQECARLL